jgi:integrase
MRLAPVKPGLTFHGLRHSHKTWMIDDNIPEIAQALRLGHILKDEVRETTRTSRPPSKPAYSNVCKTAGRKPSWITPPPHGGKPPSTATAVR